MLYAENKVATDELRRNEYVFWGVALILLAVFAGHDAWWGREAYFAETVRETVQQSNFLIPRFHQEPVRDVPLPLLLEGVLFGKLFGVSEWSLRLVTALNGWLLLAGTMALGKFFFSRRVALFAGVLLLGCGGFLYTSRLFLGAIPAAACGIWAVYLLLAGSRKSAVRPLIFSLLLFLATLFGSIYAALPPLVTGIALRFARESNRKRRNLETAMWVVSAIAFGAAVYYCGDYGILPQGFAGIAEKWSRHAVRAFFFDGLRVFFPWSLWGLVVMVRNLCTIGKLEKNFRAFTVAVVAVWLVSLIPAMENWRQMLFLAPVLSILTAATLAESETLSRIEIGIDVFIRYLVMITGAVAVASVVVIPVWKVLFKVDVSPYILLTVPVTGLLAQTLLLFNRDAAARFALPERCGGTVLAALTLTAAVICVIRPNLADFRTGREFISNNLQSPLKSLPESAILYYDDQPDAAVLFYGNCDRKLNVVGNGPRIPALREFLTRNNERFVAVIARVSPAEQAVIAEVAADFGLTWSTPSAQEKLPRFRAAARRLTLYYGNVVVKKEDVATSNSKE